MTDLSSFFESSKQLFGKFERKVVTTTTQSVLQEETAPSDTLDLAKASAIEEPKKSEKKKRKKTKKDQPDVSEEIVEKTTITEEDEKSTRTVFVGNVSLEATASQLKSFFTNNCTVSVESVRLRSVPILGCAVKEHGNKEVVRKVCTNQKKFIENRDNCNAYVVFKEEKGVEEALTLNGKPFMEKNLRVDYEKPSANAKLSVFIGNLQYDISENQIRKHFVANLGNDETAVTNVRVIRDHDTGLGKGFGYVAFKDIASVGKALQLNDSKLGKRKIRVTVCGKRFKGSAQKEKKNSFEGRRALSGASLRLSKKRQNSSKELPRPKKPKHAARKAAQMLEKSGKAAARITKQKPKHSARKSAQILEKSGQSNQDSTPKLKKSKKPKKPKHAARKAAQALAKAGEANSVSTKTTKKLPQNKATHSKEAKKTPTQKKTKKLTGKGTGSN